MSMKHSASAATLAAALAAEVTLSPAPRRPRSAAGVDGRRGRLAVGTALGPLACCGTAPRSSRRCSLTAARSSGPHPARTAGSTGCCTATATARCANCVGCLPATTPPSTPSPSTATGWPGPSPPPAGGFGCGRCTCATAVSGSLRRFLRVTYVKPVPPVLRSLMTGRTSVERTISSSPPGAHPGDDGLDAVLSMIFNPVLLTFRRMWRPSPGSRKTAALHIWVPAAAGTAVRVRHGVAEARHGAGRVADRRHAAHFTMKIVSNKIGA